MDLNWPALQIYAPAQVQKDVNREIAKFMAWSIGHCSTGLAPSRGFYGEEFAKNSSHARSAGKTLALGWKILTLQMDFFVKETPSTTFRFFLKHPTVEGPK